MGRYKPMPIHVEWGDDDHTLILAAFEGVWTVEDFGGVITQMETMTTELSHQVYAIAYPKDSQGVPIAGNLLPDMRRMFDLPVAHFVAVPSSEIAEIILEVFTTLRPRWQQRVTFADSLEEAHAIIAEKRAEASS
jgi:hypothetical protein